MKWRREGECNHCGECCKLYGVTHDPEHHRYLKGCKYFSKEFFPTEHCRIAAAPDKSVFPKEDVEFWERECVPYPDPNNPDHCPPRHTLPERCGFRMVRIE